MFQENISCIKDIKMILHLNATTVQCVLTLNEARLLGEKGTTQSHYVRKQ